jgi:hypothetical protein
MGLPVAQVAQWGRARSRWGRDYSMVARRRQLVTFHSTRPHHRPRPERPCSHLGAVVDWKRPYYSLRKRHQRPIPSNPIRSRSFQPSSRITRRRREVDLLNGRDHLHGPEFPQDYRRRLADSDPHQHRGRNIIPAGAQHFEKLHQSLVIFVDGTQLLRHLLHLRDALLGDLV